MPTANGVELCRLVDGISGAPTVVLDLNTWATGAGKPTASEWYLRAAPQLNPPPLRRSIPQTLMADGSAPPAAAFDNRTIILPLRLNVPTGASNPEATKASKLGLLAAPLNAARPVLQYQPRTSAAPTFYRLHRSPSVEVERWSPTDGTLDVTATILAEPFGYGIRVDRAPVTVTNNPAAGSNGCFLDVTGVGGDVETPALLLLDPGAGAPFAPIISTRRRGDPANDIQPFVQAEAATLGTDTTVVNPITGFSNGQGTRTTFATAGMVTRLTTSVPYTSGFPRAGARGTYRIWVALKPSSTSTTYKLRWRVNEFLGGTDLVVSDTVTWSPLSTNRCLVDLGLLQVPIGADPSGAGYGAAPTIQSVALELQMQRSAGTGTMDVDYIAVLPADTEYARIGRAGVDLTLDGPQDAIYTINDANAGLTSDGVTIPPRTGFLPVLSPGQTNRIYLLRPQNAGVGPVTDLDDITNTLIVTVSYWPRFLTWAP